MREKVLLGGAALVVEAHHPVRVHGQVGDDEADFWEQLARTPFCLGGDTAGLVPGCGLILEVVIEALDLGWRGAAEGAGQLMRDPRTQDGIGGRPDGVEIARFLQLL
jgi:hypothetical protein